MTWPRWVFRSFSLLGGTPDAGGYLGTGQYARNSSLKMAICTNGTLITPEIARRIKESGIEYAWISLDGARVEAHDRLRNSPWHLRGLSRLAMRVRGRVLCVGCGSPSRRRTSMISKHSWIWHGAWRFTFLSLLARSHRAGNQFISPAAVRQNRKDRSYQPSLPEGNGDQWLVHGVPHSR